MQAAFVLSSHTDTSAVFCSALPNSRMRNDPVYVLCCFSFYGLYIHAYAHWVTAIIIIIWYTLMSTSCGDLSTHLYVLKTQTWTRKYIIGLTSAIILRRMEYTIRFLWCSVILTLVLCSATQCEEVGTLVLCSATLCEEMGNGK